MRDELIERGVSCGKLVPSPNFSSFIVRDLDGNRFYVTRPITPQAQHDLDETAPRTQP